VPLGGDNEGGKAKPSDHSACAVGSSADEIPEEAETAVINLHGALIMTLTEWPVGTILKITNQLTHREIGGRVGWSALRIPAGRFKVGIEFVTPVTDFWGTDYDAETEEAP